MGVVGCEFGGCKIECFWYRWVNVGGGGIGRGTIRRRGLRYDRYYCFFFFSSRRRHTRLQGDWSSDVCSSDLSPRKARRARPPSTSPARTRTPGPADGTTISLRPLAGPPTGEWIKDTAAGTAPVFAWSVVAGARRGCEFPGPGGVRHLRRGRHPMARSRRVAPTL